MCQYETLDFWVKMTQYKCGGENMIKHNLVEEQKSLELDYQSAYVQLFGEISTLVERIETMGIRMSLDEVKDTLIQLLAQAEDTACR